MSFDQEENVQIVYQCTEYSRIYVKLIKAFESKGEKHKRLLVAERGSQIEFNAKCQIACIPYRAGLGRRNPGTRELANFISVTFIELGKRK